MLYCSNWSRDVGVAIPECPAQSATKTLTYGRGFGCPLGQTLVLPQSPNSREQFLLYHNSYIHVFCKSFALNEDLN